MTGGQTSMAFAMEGETQQQQGEATIQRIVRQQVIYALFLRQMKSLQLMKPVLIWWRRRAEAASGGHKYL